MVRHCKSAPTLFLHNVLLTIQANFFLVFHILTNSLGDKELLSTTGKVLSVVFEWLYLATLLTCFVLALGNRPQGSNKFYMTMVYFWAGIMLYLIFASIFITVRSVQIETKSGFKVSDIVTNYLFFTIIVSLLSTYVLWFVISFLFFDPWHMFTCVSPIPIPQIAPKLPHGPNIPHS